MKRVFIIHGWGGDPNGDWFPWLKQELEKHKFNVQVPEMPDTDYPKIEEWLKKIKEIALNVNDQVYFVGHSIGCQAIMRFLANQDKKAGGVFFVAPWFTLNPEEDKESQEIADLWTNTLIDVERFKANAGHIVSIFSSDDDVIPVEESIKLFEERVGGKIIEEEGHGHFNEKEIPILLQEILNISK